jgi:hypothetical protein
VIDLPADLLFDGLRPPRVSKTGGFGGIGGGAESMRAHVADSDGLPGGSGSCRCGGSHTLSRTDATVEATPNLLGSIQLSPCERAGSGDESTRTIVVWSLSLEERSNALCAVGGPGGNKASVGLAERLWRSHEAPMPVRAQSRSAHSAPHHHHVTSVFVSFSSGGRISAAVDKGGHCRFAAEYEAPARARDQQL